MTRVCMIPHGHFPLESDEDSDLDDEQTLKALLVLETPSVQRNRMAGPTIFLAMICTASSEPRSEASFCLKQYTVFTATYLKFLPPCWQEEV
ncbi:hypothetical protein M434DRAFT_26808 [Hypoxylon sp. CO27-5]|nr:hypothetical protein M434DRAFT_26808 [Hypoxylon sp. CO27-5]